MCVCEFLYCKIIIDLKSNVIKKSKMLMVKEVMKIVQNFFGKNEKIGLQKKSD